MPNIVINDKLCDFDCVNCTTNLPAKIDNVGLAADWFCRIYKPIIECIKKILPERDYDYEFDPSEGDLDEFDELDWEDHYPDEDWY